MLTKGTFQEYNEQARLAMDEWRKDNAAYQASKDGGAVATPATVCCFFNVFIQGADCHFRKAGYS